MDWKNIIERAAWTFLEGFLVAIPFGSEITKAALVGAAMAGLSALKTFLVEVIEKKLH